MAMWLAKAMDANLIVRACNYNNKTLDLRFDFVHQMINYEKPAVLETVKVNY